MTETLAHFPPDPAYGSGVFRRRLEFAAHAGGIAARIDDTHHAFWLTLDHDGELVTDVRAGFLRAPTTACMGAVPALEALRGGALDREPRQLLMRLPPASNCSHLRDAAIWAMAHRVRSALWKVTVPDQSDRPVWIEIARDGATMHRWQVADHHVLAPAELAGLPLMRGFAGWAGTRFGDDELMGATMLQRGVFVARGRKHIVDRGPPMPLAHAVGMAGMCWAYSGSRLERAHGATGYVRDFTAGVRPEPLPAAITSRLQDRLP